MENIIKSMRKDMLKMTHVADKTGAHIGPALSLSEIMAVLYLKVMNINPKNITDEKRDRLILSKGHGVIAQYAALKQIDLLKDEDLNTFKQNNSRLSAHPTMNNDLGIEFSSGSLGQGLSQGVGVALTLKYKQNFTPKVYVILGDGECNEGTVWEAMSSASHYKLDNLIVIVDKNNIQYDDFTKNVLDFNSLKDKFCSFGAKVIEIDGHNPKEILDSLNEKHENKPLCIIANTIKGKGVSFMENQPKWHNNILTNELYEQAINEMEGV